MECQLSSGRPAGHGVTGGTGGIVGPGMWHVVLGKGGVKVKGIIARAGLSQ